MPAENNIDEEYRNQLETPLKLKQAKTGNQSKVVLSNSLAASSVIVSTNTNHTKLYDRLTDPLPYIEREKHTSFLKPGSTFLGSQQSGRSRYEVKVTLKEVDLNRSQISGFLIIHGLTDAYPKITTFFRGEVIGKRYSFFTQNENWESSSKNDLQHWARFPSWRNLNFNIENELENKHIYDNALNNDYLYMRWKELFLYPDSKIHDIKGASFAGFYYICFNQLTGGISGLYFHKSSDKFQQLDLNHVPDGGLYPTYQYA